MNTRKDPFAILAEARGSIDMALGSLAREGTIRRIRRGLYDMPKLNPALGGKLSPDIDEAAQAIARRQRWKIVPEGAWAANLLGLSTQVPAKIIYLTDGPSKEVEIGRGAFISNMLVRKRWQGLKENWHLWSRRSVISEKRTWEREKSGQFAQNFLRRKKSGS